MACGTPVHVYPTLRKTNSAQVGGTAFVPSLIDTDEGRLDVETEYIPGVVACEIGSRYWGVAAMEAQAIAARTYLARFLKRTKGARRIPIGPRFQCWKRTQNESIIRAAKATAGQVLLHQGRLITGNYVAGTPKLTFDCLPKAPTDSNYDYSSWTDMLTAYRDARRTTGRTPFRGTAWTEIFVTRNEGRKDQQVTPSAIANPVASNRGALGQNAAVCLANNLGYETIDILRYFYGEDVKLAL